MMQMPIITLIFSTIYVVAIPVPHRFEASYSPDTEPSSSYLVPSVETSPTNDGSIYSLSYTLTPQPSGMSFPEPSQSMKITLQETMASQEAQESSSIAELVTNSPAYANLMEAASPVYQPETSMEMTLSTTVLASSTPNAIVAESSTVLSTMTATASAPGTASSKISPSMSCSMTASLDPTTTPTVTPSATNTPTPTASVSPTPTPIVTASATSTPIPTASVSPTTPTATASASSAPTLDPPSVVDQTPTSTTSMASKKPSCGDQVIVLDVGRVSPTSFWMKSDGGLTWRKGDTRKKIDGPGSGAICFTVKPMLPGAFLVSATTRAAHSTDHNDLWISCAAGLEGRKGSQIQRFGRKWVKAYQNAGPDVWASEIYTINFHPRRIYTGRLSGKTELCISGRSSRFTVRDIRLRPDNCVRFN